MSDEILVDPFLNVGTSKKATTQFIPDRPLSLDGIILALSTPGGVGDTFLISDIDNVTVKAGGKDLFRLTGTRLDNLNNRAGIAKDTEFLLIPFADFTARTVRGQHLGSYDMTVYKKPLTIQVDIGSAAVNPELEARALISVPKALMDVKYLPGEIQMHRALIETIIQPAAAVTKKGFGIGLGSEAGALVRTLNFFHSNLTEINVKRNGLAIYEDVGAALNNYIEQDIFARNTVSGLLTWDPTVDGNQSKARTTVNRDGSPASYQVQLTTSAADTITCLADVYSKLALL